MRCSIVLLSSAIAATAFCQPPGDDLIWMKSSEGNGLQMPLVDSDNDCAILVAARYRNPSTWYAEYEGTMLYSDVDPTWDQVLLKLDDAGNLLWHKRIYGDDIDVVGMTHDQNNNWILFLIALGPMTVDGQVTATRFTVLKIDPAGTLLWHTDIDGCLFTGPQQLRASLDPQGRILVAATVDQANAIVPVPLSVNGTVYPTTPAWQGFFLCRLDPATGAVDQINQYTTPPGNHRLRLAGIDASAGDIYVTGDTDDNTPYLVVDGDTLDGGPGHYNQQCLLRIAENGTILWGHTYFGDPNNVVIAWDVEVAPGGGSVLLSANYYLSADYDGTALTSSGLQDILVLKVDAAGTFQWVRSAGSSSSNNTGHLTVSSSGWNVLAGLGNMDIRMIKYDDAGTIEWTLPYEGEGNQMGGNAAFTACDELLHVGTFNDRMDVGPHTFYSIPWTLRDMYVLKFASGTISTSMDPFPTGPVPARAWPNPSDGPLNFQLPDGTTVATVVLSDATGREVLRSAVNSKAFTLDGGSLMAGVYTYLLYEANGGLQASGVWTKH